MAGSRSGERTTSCARWRPRRRKSGAGPSTGTPARGHQVPDRLRRRELGAGLHRRAHRPDQVPIGRIAERLAPLQLAGHEAVGVVSGRVTQRARRRVERLDDHPPAPLPASAAAGELGHEREGALLRAEVREAQRGVGIEDHGQRDGREVVALGHHLGAHEHTGGRGVEAAQHRAARARGGHVGVEPEHGQRPHQLLELPLELLRARPVARHRRGPAVAAHRRNRLTVPAVVAGHLGGGAVQDERHVAVGALPHPAAARGTRGSSTSHAG